MNPFRLTASALFALSLAACAVGPNYKTPGTAPAVFHNADPAAFIAANPEAAWWRQFEDPVLDQLVTRALSSNLDLKVAVARVAEARALFTDQRLDQLPRVGVAGGSTQSRQQQPGSGEARVETESIIIARRTT